MAFIEMDFASGGSVKNTTFADGILFYRGIYNSDIEWTKDGYTRGSFSISKGTVGDTLSLSAGNNDCNLLGINKTIDISQYTYINVEYTVLSGSDAMVYVGNDKNTDYTFYPTSAGTYKYNLSTLSVDLTKVYIAFASINSRNSSIRSVWFSNS